MGNRRPYTRYDGTVWLKKHWDIKPFEWGGPTMSVGDITTSNTGIAVDTRMTPAGGVERGGSALTDPGLTTTDLVMKRTQLDAVKMSFARNLWDVDMRMHCNGMDTDNPFAWQEITRLCQSKFAQHTITGTTFNTDDEEQLIQIAVQAVERVDIKRVVGSELNDFVAGNLPIKAVTIAKRESGIEQCDVQEDCILYAVTEDNGVRPLLLINESGGDISSWSSVALTDFGANNADDIIGFGNFFVAISHDDDSIIYSDDQGANQVEVSLANPLCITASDDFFILVGCDSGVIHVSYDNARTWSILHNALATSNNIIDIQFSPDDYQIIYALTASEVIRTENGGESWHALASTGAAGNHTSMHVMSSKQIFVGTNQGELFQTAEGGESWTEQTDIDFDSTKAITTIKSITGCSCGVLWLSYFSAGTASRIMRNVDFGAEGMWYVPDGEGAIVNTHAIEDMVCCNPNRLIGVGGTVTDTAVLLK